MNIGQMLVQLGFVNRERATGFPRPAVITREKTPIFPSTLLETRDQIDAYIDTHTTVGERAITKQIPGNWV